MFIGECVKFEGVVEDILDPLEISRVRVRIIGIHTPQKVKSSTEGIPTEELQWAAVSMPVTSASMNGIGDTSRLVKGTWVHGYFRDGYNYKLPVVEGTILGIPNESPDPSKGFNDPDGVYPKQSHLGEPDTNRLARNKKIDETIVHTKTEQRITGVESSIGEVWDEPEVPYNAVYPMNRVIESESGHIIEIDDTPDHERINVHHRSGTFIEIHPDGSVVRKLKGNGYEIVEKDNNIYIMGSSNITVDGNHMFYVKSDMNVKCDGDYNMEVMGNYNVTVTGDFFRHATKIQDSTDGANMTLDSNAYLDGSKVYLG